MPSDLYLPTTDAGWHAVALVQADQAQHVPGLQEIGAHVRAGTIRPDTSILHALRDPGGGYPAVRAAVILTDAEVLALRHGDASVARDVVEALEEAYDELLTNAKEGKAT